MDNPENSYDRMGGTQPPYGRSRSYFYGHSHRQDWNRVVEALCAAALRIHDEEVPVGDPTAGISFRPNLGRTD